MVVDSVNGMRGPKVVERALRRWPGAVVYWLGRDSVPMMDTLPAHLRGSVRTADPFGSDLRALERIAVRADAEGPLQRRREAFVARRALEALGSSGSRRLRAQTLLTLLAHGTPDAILHDLMGYPSSDALNDYRRKTFSFEPRSMTMVELVQLIRQTESMLTRSDAWPDALAVPNRDRRYHRAR
jgi:hypothetical protein